MAETTLVSCEQLLRSQAQAEGWVVLDCSFDLTDPERGERLFKEAHIPGAQYVNLDRDLSSPGGSDPRGKDFRGRHPLPERSAFATRVGSWGIGPQTQVVMYDNMGSMYAARAWWMLRWLGHSAVAVLDGGLATWRAAGGMVAEGAASSSPKPPYPATEGSAMGVIDADALLAQLGHVKIMDARSLERWRGEGETLDPVGGHIPGSISRFFKDNLQADGRFKMPDVLRAEFERLGAGRPNVDWVHQCGSGVTACHNLLAMTHAGLSGGSLYPGSWSEWCADPDRPIARG
jgi:thiosulfate/3-mercaptopyruvate sulfurtransferase